MPPTPRPAYMLTDEGMERHGRKRKPKPPREIGNVGLPLMLIAVTLISGLILRRQLA